MIIKKNNFISTKIDLKEVRIIIKNNIFVQSKMNDNSTVYNIYVYIYI